MSKKKFYSGFKIALESGVWRNTNAKKQGVFLFFKNEFFLVTGGRSGEQ